MRTSVLGFLGLIVFVSSMSAAPRASGDVGSIVDRIAAFHGVESGGEQVFDGHGFVTDASHPKRPGDFHREELKARFAVAASRGDAIVEFESIGETPETERYFIRRGRPFQLDEALAEIAATKLGDLTQPAIAALHPALVARALAARRENVRVESNDGRSRRTGVVLFAWNDELWRVHFDSSSGCISKLDRRVYSDVLGDGTEEIRFEDYKGHVPSRVVVFSLDRELARFDLTASTKRAAPIALPEEKENWSERVLSPEEIALVEVAPHLFTIDLRATNSRVVVAEFKEHVAVLEGAYNARNGDLIARAIERRLGKPIRYFSFSHLHGQYIGSVRSFVHEDAVVLVPPSTAPLIGEIATAKHDLRPDAQSRDPKAARVDVVKDKLTLADDVNAMTIYNVESDHTDEYLVFHFPRQKLLLTGDLLFFRGSEQPLRGRSKKLCTTLANLALDVETMLVTWPLEGYGGVRNLVGFDEFRAGCEQP